MESKAGLEARAASRECPHLFPLGLASPSSPGSSKWSVWGCRQHTERLSPAHSLLPGCDCRTEHNPAAHQCQDTAGEHNWVLSCSGSPSSEIRGVAIAKQDLVCGISSLQIWVVAPCAWLMPLSSIRTCVPVS